MNRSTRSQRPHTSYAINACDALIHPVSLASARFVHLPTLYQVSSHPMAPEGHEGRIFVALRDMEKESLEAFSDWIRNAAVPEDDVHALSALGEPL